jgi:alkanesulfonate monooxygenase SsuD/methylene tetrahydromethanopterin reductase-like flavin-dependent oxidoreductase (luciferase family)
MKFGLGPYWLEGTDHHRRFREMVQQALLAQECAFDSVWLGEAHFTGQGCCPHPFVPAAALAVQADALRIGVLCHLSLVHPAYVAEDAVTVDNISNGRLLMALALPWRPQEAEGYGLDPTEALARFWEGVEVLRHGWAPQPFAFQGQHYRIPARLPANRPDWGCHLPYPQASPGHHTPLGGVPGWAGGGGGPSPHAHLGPPLAGPR